MRLKCLAMAGHQDPAQHPGQGPTGQCDPPEEQGPSRQGPTGQCSKQAEGLCTSPARQRVG